MVHIAETMEGEKGSYITETMERQHGGLVLSVHESLTRTVYMIYIASSFKSSAVDVLLLAVNRRGCILSEPLPHVPGYTSGYISVKN